MEIGWISSSDSVARDTEVDGRYVEYQQYALREGS